MYTQLNDRVLWYDGASSFSANDIVSKMKQYRVRWVDKITADVTAYNSLKLPKDQIKVKTSCEPFVPEWISEVQDIHDDDVFDFVSMLHARIASRVDETEIELREERLAQELMLFRNNTELWNVLKCMIYIVNELTVNKQVWGVGRGSSVSSYLLYVIGAHDVDSFKYDLDVSDFITT